jgi:hypothetical protein
MGASTEELVSIARRSLAPKRKEPSLSPPDIILLQGRAVTGVT